MDKQLTPEEILNSLPRIEGDLEYTYPEVLKAMELQTAALQAQVQELEEESQDRRGEMRAMYDVYIESQSRIAELEREMEQNQESWEQGRNEITTLEHHLTKSEQQTAALQAQVQELEGDVENWKKNYDILFKISEGLQGGNESYKSRIAELESAVTEWRYATGAANERTWKVQKELADSQQHAENLTNLLEEEFRQCSFYMLLSSKDGPFNNEEVNRRIEEAWQSYKQEHGLQSPENPLP